MQQGSEPMQQDTWPMIYNFLTLKNLF
jgi:hypothetical protein